MVDIEICVMTAAENDQLVKIFGSSDVSVFLGEEDEDLCWKLHKGGTTISLADAECLWSLVWISPLSEDEIFFRRSRVAPDAYLYFIDSIWVTGSLKVVGISDSGDECAIEMFKRSIDKDGFLIPAKIEISKSNAFDAKKILQAWSGHDIYKDDPVQFLEDMRACSIR